ncbi:spore germination protein [Tumebacillus flagellatus]|uniref:Spore gernimation protein n=1 Tax=Tumebacillus flagellatus TaxID=1157490 RepID=A0A074LRQ4_9BACL|nr:spore germination protein [Tumebacillus flagellatus]KEO82523.1 spore gernimation protein [Tumebacillus flagellatus]
MGRYQRRKTKDAKQSQVLENRFEEQIRKVPDDELLHHTKGQLEEIRRLLGDSNDLVIRDFSWGHRREWRAHLVFLDGLVKSETIDEQILAPLMLGTVELPPLEPFEPDQAPEIALRHLLPRADAQVVLSRRELVRGVLSGSTALLFEGASRGLLLNTQGWEKRSVQPPVSESVVRGPREGFTETLRVNTALIRRRIKDPDLRIVNMKIGTRTATDVSMIYIDGLADRKVVQEMENRLKSIRTDSILESGYIEQFIEDSHWSPFPMMQNTERSDKAVANLLEGKLVLLVDGSPFALIAPVVFAQLYQSPEDYYERFLIATLLRLIRALSMTMALLLPSFYIAFTSFHPEMIPSKLVIAMAAGRATVPFPSVVEALAMEISIEILREASVRLPGPIGPTIGIVGALIVGEAAVRAGIVSPIMVIVVALTTIGSFAAPSYNAAIALRMLRFPVMLLAAAFGLYGIMLFFIFIVVHLCSLKSFGVPYLAPLTPSNLLQMGDSMIRIPLYNMRKKPNLFAENDELERTNPTSAEDIEPYEPSETTPDDRKSGDQ